MAGLAGAPPKTTQPAAVPGTRQEAGTATQSPRQTAGGSTQSTRPVAGVAILSTQPEAQEESPFAQPAGPIEVDYSDTGSSDGYESGNATDTTSLASTVMSYVYENGRRYHSYREGVYVLPNDEAEQDRLDLVHHIYCMLLEGRLHLINFKENPQRILDVGTGTGIWAIDVADENPWAEVIGMDLSPIQPKWVPANCTFLVDDAEGHWNWPNNHFDFIHSRALAFSIADWPGYLDRIYKHTKPGGWVQLVEHDLDLHSDDGSFTDTTSIGVYMSTIRDSLEKVGKDPHVSKKLANYAKSAGFINVGEVSLKTPISNWPKDKKFKELGRWILAASETGREAHAIALMTRAKDKKSQEEVRAFLDNVKKEQVDRSIHAYQYHRFVFGQKPEETDQLASPKR